MNILVAFRKAEQGKIKMDLAFYLASVLFLLQRPRQQSLGGVLRREGNWKCFTLTLMIAGCLGSVAWCNTAEIDRDLIDFSK